MQPKTSVRPIIAGARRQDLSDLLRKWRRQPQKRSPRLFWMLLALALLSDCGLLALAVRFLSVRESFLPGMTWESWLCEYGPARQALYWSFLAVGFLAAAAMVRPWRSCCLFAGRLACLGCLIWSATTLVSQAIQDGAGRIGEGSQGMLWISAVVLGLGLFLARISRDGSLARAGVLVSCIGFLAANFWPTLPPDAVRVHGLILQSAYAALALAWGAAALALARILLAAHSSERLYRWATLCLWPIRIGVGLLTMSLLLSSFRALQQGLAWQDWKAQSGGALLVWIGCVALLFARRRGWLPPFHLLAAVVLGLTFAATMGQASLRQQTGERSSGPVLAVEAAICAAGLVSLSLTTHAALRFYFGKQRIFVA